MRGAFFGTCLGILSVFGASWAPASDIELLSFHDLIGWNSDNHAAALETFSNTCGDLDDPAWGAICAIGKSAPDAKEFFETFFRPVAIKDGDDGLITGYYEPEIAASRQKTGAYRFPIYRKPPEVSKGTLWHDRRTIETSGIMDNRGLEIAWASDAAALFYMQIQGSGRLRFRDGSVLRLGYGGTNGHVFRSPSDMLVERGIYNRHQASSAVVGNWVRRNPVEGLDLLRNSKNYVFFRTITDIPPSVGPKGAMNRSITAGRTLAVDRRHYDLGVPIWMEKGGEDISRKLMVAQDTGSAIKGAQRADFFVGSGAEAGRIASRMHDPVRLVALLPIDLALALDAKN